jgi:transcriptional regulator with XRE-family HTH domain
MSMATVHSPTAGRRRLRTALRHARDAATLTQEQVAQAMDWSLSKVIRIETGGVGISTSDLRQLLQLYRVNDPDRVDELVELARIGRRRPWWTRYKETVPAHYLSYVGLEDECSAMRCFYPVGMLGLLQTERYALAMTDASWVGRASAHDKVWPLRLTPAETAERVELRMTRQRVVFERDSPPEIVAILDEAVLRRELGGADVLREQLLHLLELSERPYVTIQVLPFTAHRVNMLSPFVILEFPDPADTDVVYAESTFEQSIVDEPGDVESYRQVFAWLHDAALDESKSREMIARVAGELG